MKRALLVVFLLVGAVSCYPGSTRVVNGTTVSKSETYPYVVSLRRNGRHFCGGSLIDQDWVLTAAACMENVRPSQLTVQYGVLNITEKGPTVLGIRKIIIHEDYTGYDFGNDIALIQLSEPVQYNITDPIKLSNTVGLPNQGYQVPANSEATLLGWGVEKTGGTVQTELQEVQLNVYSVSECNSFHLGRTNINNICAGVDEGGKGQCVADYGGPLVRGGVQIGIVSWCMKPCTRIGYPGVYTNVAAFANWIRANKI